MYKFKKGADSPREVSIHAILEEQTLECLAHVQLVRGIGGTVHRAVAHDEDPRGLAAVDLRQILLQPMPLLIGLGLMDTAIDVAEWTTVGDEGLGLTGQGLVAGHVLRKVPLRAVGKVGLTVNRDEVSKTVVKGVPEVTDTTGLGTRHAEAVLVSGEVSTTVSYYLWGLGEGVCTSEKEDSCSRSGYQWEQCHWQCRRSGKQ